MTIEPTGKDPRSEGKTADDTSGFAADYYLKIEGVRGESNDRSRPIEVLSFSWGMSQPGSFAGGR